MEKALPIGRIEMETNWRQWCRLCASDYQDNVNFFSFDSAGLVVAIGKYFWVDIKVDDGLSQCLCRECHYLVEYMIKFSEQVHRVQKMYEKLQCAKPGSNIRKECGDWVHKIPWRSRSQNPETATIEELDDMDVANVEDFLIIEEQEEEEAKKKIQENKKEELEEENVEYQEQYVEDQEQLDEHQGEICKDQEQVNESHEQVDENQEQAQGYQKDDDEDQMDELDNYEMEMQNITADLAEFDNNDFDDGTEDELEPNSDTSFHIPGEDVGVNVKMPLQYKCKICPKTYKKHTAYKRHMATTHGSYLKHMPNYQCQHCDSTFPTINQLTAHYRIHIVIKEKNRNSCPMCTKLFTTAGALNRHIAGTHKKITPYVCDICGKAVKTLGSLKDHKLVHTDACPFECDVCHRRFKNKSRLRVHSDSHTEGYKCDICGMILKTRRTLNTHRQVHSDERKCKCEVCGATFKRTKTLKSHLILHTGIRPYKCNFCGAAFANGSNCRMHKRKKHPKELAEEEARRVIRSTRLPLIDDLNEASKRIKTPAKKQSVRTKSTKTKSINPSNDLGEDEDDILKDLAAEIEEKLSYLN